MSEPPFLQSRSHYQPGYLMSMSQNNHSPQASQRLDELPVVQTKAKLNQSLMRASTSEFGKDPMFESSRQRQTLDEDAPPLTSVNDIVNATYTESPSTFLRRNTPSEVFAPRPSHTPQQAAEPLYVIVFGYPPDKYSVAVEYFKQFGETTEPDPHTEVVNCFRIGYKQPGDAMRAVRKNGEVVSGNWMVGAKWANPSQAESILGQSVSLGRPPLQSQDVPMQAGSISEPMSVDDTFQPHARTGSLGTRQSHPGTPSVGTPIRLAPSAAAFKKPGSGQKPGPIQQPQFAMPTSQAAAGPGGFPLSPSKGMLGQVSDLIFGW
ncbi:hypothetical protein EWM64_g712 [Hericium alpestre]|uniref:RRM Nup35-type domain-containing protein n=1 Tax=Hericium alpestre TaxID=135208 RepID=A0A4Z0AAM1_9AGAM|nr:hypothetical protein EWM64_g712 [Hericium alpestre]